jgi:hypothetical protein
MDPDAQTGKVLVCARHVSNIARMSTISHLELVCRQVTGLVSRDSDCSTCCVGKAL